MERIFNMTSVISGIIGGVATYLLGGWDIMLKALVALVILDYITGVLKGIYTKTLSSEIGFKGLIKKIIVFMVVATACVISRILDNSIPLREITIIFFVSNEGISLLENASQLVPIPIKLKEVLIQLREEKDDEKDV